MRYVIIDLEATCWEKGTSPDRMEIIEIGAALLESSSGPVLRTFGEFVRPVRSPVLSEFCRQLTTIQQANVDGAEPFPQVLRRLLDWIGTEPYTLCSWGAYDLGQLRVDCQRHGIPLPPAFERHINLKKEYSRLRGIQPTGMQGALLKEGILLEGAHHRGVDDAKNIAKLALIVLPWLEAPSSPSTQGASPGTDTSNKPSTRVRLSIADEIRERALALEDAGDVKTAEALLQYLAYGALPTALDHYYLGVLRFKKCPVPSSDKEAASFIDEFERALAMAPRFADAYFMSGWAHECYALWIAHDVQRHPDRYPRFPVEKIDDLYSRAIARTRRAVEFNPNFERIGRDLLARLALGRARIQRMLRGVRLTN